MLHATYLHLQPNFVEIDSIIITIMMMIDIQILSHDDNLNQNKFEFLLNIQIQIIIYLFKYCRKKGLNIDLHVCRVDIDSLHIGSGGDIHRSNKMNL